MADDIKLLLEEVQKDFVESAKTRFKGSWDNLPAEVKKAVEFTARHGVKVASRVASGEDPNKDPLRSEIAVLNANVKDIEVMASLEFRAFMDELLSTAAKIGGTVFRKFAKAVIGI